MYCTHCRRIMDDAFCPTCLKPTREPLPDDECFLTERAALWRSMLADVLTEAGVPFRTVPALGAALALRMGPLAEAYRFYVPMAYLAQAQQLTEDLFAPADTEDAETPGE